MQRVTVDLYPPDSRFLAIYIPYDEAFLGELRARVPIDARLFDRDRKCWVIARYFWHVVSELLEEFFGVAVIDVSTMADAAFVEMMEDEVEANRVRQNDEDCMTEGFAAHQILGIRTDAEDCVLHAAYAALNHEHAITKGEANIPPKELIDAAYLSICEWREITPKSSREIIYDRRKRAQPTAVANYFNRKKKA